MHRTSAECAVHLGRLRPAKTHHAAARADREDDPEPGIRSAQKLLAKHLAIRRPIRFSGARSSWRIGFGSQSAFRTLQQFNGHGEKRVRKGFPAESKRWEKARSLTPSKPCRVMVKIISVVALRKQKGLQPKAVRQFFAGPIGDFGWPTAMPNARQAVTLPSPALTVDANGQSVLYRYEDRRPVVAVGSP